MASEEQCVKPVGDFLRLNVTSFSQSTTRTVFFKGSNIALLTSGTPSALYLSHFLFFSLGGIYIAELSPFYLWAISQSKSAPFSPHLHGSHSFLNHSFRVSSGEPSSHLSQKQSGNLFGMYTHAPHSWTSYIVSLSIGIAFLNLLPARPLDGSSISDSLVYFSLSSSCPTTINMPEISDEADPYTSLGHIRPSEFEYASQAHERCGEALERSWLLKVLRLGLGQWGWCLRASERFVWVALMIVVGGAFVRGLGGPWWSPGLVTGTGYKLDFFSKGVFFFFSFSLSCFLLVCLNKKGCCFCHWFKTSNFRLTEEHEYKTGASRGNFSCGICLVD